MWAELVGEAVTDDVVEEGGAYFYQLWYDQDTARFETLPKECFYDNQQSEECHSCKRTTQKNKVTTLITLMTVLL